MCSTLVLVFAYTPFTRPLCVMCLFPFFPCTLDYILVKFWFFIFRCELDEWFNLSWSTVIVTLKFWNFNNFVEFEVKNSLWFLVNDYTKKLLNQSLILPLLPSMILPCNLSERCATLYVPWKRLQSWLIYLDLNTASQTGNRRAPSWSDKNLENSASIFCIHSYVESSYVLLQGRTVSF